MHIKVEHMEKRLKLEICEKGTVFFEHIFCLKFFCLYLHFKLSYYLFRIIGVIFPNISISKKIDIIELETKTFCKKCVEVSTCLSTSSSMWWSFSWSSFNCSESWSDRPVFRSKSRLSAASSCSESRFVTVSRLWHFSLSSNTAIGHIWASLMGSNI